MKKAASVGGLFFCKEERRLWSHKAFAGYQLRETGRRPQNNAN
jgi:hypothetical protein